MSAQNCLFWLFFFHFFFFFVTLQTIHCCWNFFLNYSHMTALLTVRQPIHITNPRVLQRYLFQIYSIFVRQGCKQSSNICSKGSKALFRDCCTYQQLSIPFTCWDIFVQSVWISLKLIFDDNESGLGLCHYLKRLSMSFVALDCIDYLITQQCWELLMMKQNYWF